MSTYNPYNLLPFKKKHLTIYNTAQLQKIYCKNINLQTGNVYFQTQDKYFVALNYDCAMKGSQ